MSAWGPGGTAKSCDSLLQRVEQNDPTLLELVVLSNKTFGSREVERLAAAIATGRNTNLQSLSASGHALPPSSLELLGSAIAKGERSSLVRLAIGDKHMGDNGAVALCAGLRNLAIDNDCSDNQRRDDKNDGGSGGRLQELDLEWKTLSTNAMAALGAAFGRSQSIQKLNLSRNPGIGDEGLVAFCTSAANTVVGHDQSLSPTFSSLHELNLAECGVGPTGIESLVKLFLADDSSKDGVKRDDGRSLALVLNGNPLRPKACQSLSTLLFHSSIISSLSMSNCQIGNEGIQIMINAALASSGTTGGSSSVTMLDISDNGIGAAGAQALASSLWNDQTETTCWPKLVDLRLAKNSLLESGIVTLMNALTMASTTAGSSTSTLVSSSVRNRVVLQSLDLTQTSCGAKGASAAVKSTCLKSLRLFNNKLGSDGFVTLAPLLLGGHASLVNLDLGGNDASAAAVVTLLNAIANYGNEDKDFCSSLRVLEIGGNQGGSNVEEAVKRAQQVHPELDIARDRPKSQQLN